MAALGINLGGIQLYLITSQTMAEEKSNGRNRLNQVYLVPNLLVRSGTIAAWNCFISLKVKELKPFQGCLRKAG